MSEERDALLVQIEELRRQMEELREEVRAARRGRRGVLLGFLGLAALGLAVSGLWLPLTQAQQQPPREINGQPDKKDGGVQPVGGQPNQQNLVVQSLKIVSPDGKERLTLGFDNISGFVKVHGPDGKPRAALWADNSSKYGLLSLMDDNGKDRIVMAGNDKGSGCSFYGSNLKRHIYLGTANDVDGGIVTLYGPQQDKAMVHLGHDKEGGLVWVNGHDGKARASLWVAKGGKSGLLNIHEDDKSRVTVGADDHGGFIDLEGANGKRQVALDCHDKWGGALNLFTPTAGKLVYAGGNTTNGHGLFQLYGTDGQVRVEGLVDQGGVGNVQGINANNQMIRSLK
jgi:hypothetical protein